MSVPERLGRALRQAGVSITVTSLTDIVAFAIGTSTVSTMLYRLNSINGGGGGQGSALLD